MIKCPLCGWNNPESTQHCISCGGDLESRMGLVKEDDNPNCYRYTPPRRILNKGIGVWGSGNDLVFKFSSSRLAIFLIVIKIFFLAAFPYAIIKLNQSGNSLFYIFIPLTILDAIDVVGWILFAYGGRKKKRSLMRLGMRLLYAFHVISMAYCILTMLITIYISLALGFSWDLSNYIGASANSIPDEALNFSIALTILLLLSVIFLNICAKFFFYTHDIFTRNSLKLYPFTSVIAVVFIIWTVMGFACISVLTYGDLALDIVSRSAILSTYFYPMIERHKIFVTFCVGAFALISLISAIMVIEYIKNYKKLFIKS